MVGHGESLSELFEPGNDVSEIRDAVTGVSGRSEVIVRYRLLQRLSWFLQADHEWTDRYLIDPLRNLDAVAHQLWPAIEGQAASVDALQIIGDLVVQQVANPHLPRETRCSLAINVVFTWLSVSVDDQDPPVSRSEVQQMLRRADDEVRAAAAHAAVRFLRHELSNDGDDGAPARAVLLNVIKLFFEEVWPQERSLATPGVSEVLATLPAAASEGFAGAVATIDRFLVPFPCWDMATYGLYEDDSNQSKFLLIDDEAKGRALLTLLDKTVGTSEDAIVPYDLSYALHHIRSVAPSAAKRPAFRRLAAIGRQ